MIEINSYFDLKKIRAETKEALIRAILHCQNRSGFLEENRQIYLIAKFIDSEFTENYISGKIK